MRKPISTKVHGIIDLLSAGAMLTLPRVLDCGQPLKSAATMMGVGKLVYGLMTRHELGLVKKIPMKTHLWLDTIAGASTAALPFLLDEDEPHAISTCVAMGMMDVVVAQLTKTHSTVEGPAAGTNPSRFRDVASGRSAVLS